MKPLRDKDVADPPLRIALYTYSTQPRGGVVHCLALAEALQAKGHYVHLYALGKPGQTAFFRPTSVPYTLIPVEDRGTAEPMDERIQRYIRSYFQFLAGNLKDAFDIHHAEDCVSGNALWQLRDAGVIPAFVRTIHHIDDFTSPSLIECQENSVHRPDLKVVVSRYWRERISQEFGEETQVIHNGVDVGRFRPPNAGERADARAGLGFGDRFVFLAIGGVDPRKNSIRLLKAFQRVKARGDAEGRPVALVLAGGATLLDYQAYRGEFQEELGRSGLRPGQDIFMLGVVPEEQVRRLYWAADALAFPSVKEGWGLVALEALASGLPVLASDIPVFREYLRHEENAILVDPAEEQSIAAGMDGCAPMEGCADGCRRRVRPPHGSSPGRRRRRPTWPSTGRGWPGSWPEGRLPMRIHQV